MAPGYRPEQGISGYYAAASLGKGRWYWVVWPALERAGASAGAPAHSGEGTAETRSDALAKAAGLAGRNAKKVAAKYARLYHASRKGAKPNSEAGQPLQEQEFLYRDVYDVQSKQWVPVPHRVARRTKKFVFIEQNPYMPEQPAGSWFDQAAPTFRLDRSLLEREGYAYVPAAASAEDADEFYFLNAREKPPKMAQPRCIQALHLTWPCSQEAVKRAYRRLARSAHPDGGGSGEAFLALQDAYEQALKLYQG